MNAERFLLAQINACVGDFEGNLRKIREALEFAKKRGDGAVVFPEMAVTGYPPEDLVFKPGFLRDNAQALRRLASFTRGLLVFAGSIEKAGDGRLYNSAFVFRDGRLETRYRKMCLPNYGVFDEARYFAAGRAPLIVRHRGIRIAVSICEDLWLPHGAYARALKAGSADLLINLSASPYERNKHGLRARALAPVPRRLQIPLLYTNLVGGQDELVFDGQSFVMDGRGRVVSRAHAFEEHFFEAVYPLDKPLFTATPLDPDEEVYRALVRGTRDYVEKNRFPKVLIGLSGGIDSALVAAIAVDALGPRRVVGVTMPSAVTSSATLEDAHRLARSLSIRILELPIRPIFRSFESALRRTFRGLRPGTAEENLQARIRGTLLMALSNKFGWLVLTTGNKSETAAGYCTLYGDMAGGFAVIKDVPKTLVYRLVRHLNRFGRERIPGSIVRRPPTAELRPGQKDQDTLPPYDKLDRFIEHYVDRDVPAERARAASGVTAETARQVARMIDRNEYKRRQAPPGIKITSKAFGRDRRMPITNRYEG